MKGILLLFHGSWKLAEDNQRRLDQIKMLSILFSLIFSVQQCGGDARVLERYERQLNNLQNKMNKGRPMIVNGKLKRFRCIEEYVLVDDMGNPIESSSIQPGSSLAYRPAVQAQQQFYTKKTASLFSTPTTLSSLPTTSIWTTTTLPRQSDPIVNSPGPFTHISSSTPSLSPKDTMDYSRTHNTSPLTSKLGIKKLPVSEKRKSEHRFNIRGLKFSKRFSRRSLEKVKNQGSKSVPASSTEMEYADYTYYDNKETEQEPMRHNNNRKMMYKRRGSYLPEDTEDDYNLLRASPHKNSYYSRMTRRFPSMLHRHRPLMPHPMDTIYEDEVDFPETTLTDNAQQQQSNLVSKTYSKDRREPGTVQQMWHNIKDSTERGRIKSNSQEQLRSVEAVKRPREIWPDGRNKNVSNVKCFHSGERNKIECGSNPSSPSSPYHSSNMSPQKNANSAKEVSDDLQMSPENCQKVTNYAKMFGVSNPKPGCAIIALLCKPLCTLLVTI